MPVCYNVTMELKDWLLPQLRRIHYRWPNRQKATEMARVARGKYFCAACQGVFGPKEIQRDHIIPVQNIEGWDGWEALIARLFCDVEGYQILCKPCHHAKSSKENKGRKRCSKK